MIKQAQLDSSHSKTIASLAVSETKGKQKEIQRGTCVGDGTQCQTVSAKNIDYCGCQRRKETERNEQKTFPYQHIVEYAELDRGVNLEIWG